jgi:hypothetical protein
MVAARSALLFNTIRRLPASAPTDSSLSLFLFCFPLPSALQMGPHRALAFMSGRGTFHARLTECCAQPLPDLIGWKEL